MRKLGSFLLCAVTVCQPVMAADSLADPHATVSLYARRFDNAYTTAARGRPAPVAAPYDAAAADDAQQAHDQAVDACMDRQASFASRRAWMECFLAADAAYAASVHLNDALLLASFQASVRTAGDDADAGRLAPEQLASVYFALAETYIAIIHDQQRVWTGLHPAKP